VTAVVESTVILTRRMTQTIIIDVIAGDISEDFWQRGTE
jgi:hypothetical protein